MNKEEWINKGTELFGENKLLWRFKCPACGHIQSVEDYKKANAPESAVAFSCVGIWLKESERKDMLDSKDKREVPCNYAGGRVV